MPQGGSDGGYIEDLGRLPMQGGSSSGYMDEEMGGFGDQGGYMTRPRPGASEDEMFGNMDLMVRAATVI